MKFWRSKIIPIFLPHQGCPHRCIFCNQERVTGNSTIHKPSDIARLIGQYLETMDQARRKRPDTFPERIEAAFYGGNFTGLPEAVQRDFLWPAYQAVQRKEIDGLRISTRPDYVTESGLQLLAEYGVKVVELGVQSLDHMVLQKSRRTYSEEQVERAVNLLHGHQFCIGLHLMIGLPGESFEARRYTSEKIIRLAPHFLRLHPTLVLKGTELEAMYRQGDYTPLTLEHTIAICKELVIQFKRAGMAVARIGLQSIPSMEESVIAGPFHPSLGELVFSSMAYDRLLDLLTGYKDSVGKVTILVPERELSIFIGQQHQNLHRLQQRFGCKDIFIAPDKSLEEGEIRYQISSTQEDRSFV